MLDKKSFSLVYVAKPDYINELCEEIQDVSWTCENLVFSSRKIPAVCFATDIWFNPQLQKFNSISEAAKILRQAGKYWFLNPLNQVRRSRLIEEQLPQLPSLNHAFPLEKDLPPMGCFSLLDKNTLIYATHRWKKWPLGHCQFIEDKINPPNRAYLKLWEALSLFPSYPQAGENALDLGASPGGWTWVMQARGTRVTAVDKAPLDPRIAQLPGVSYLQQSAFALEPQALEKKIDWLLGDIACYPERLYALVKKWIAADKAKQMIFTLKFQGKTDLSMIDHFKSLPQSRIIHLFYNKHEACFFHPAPPALFYD